MYICLFLFCLLVTGFSWDAGGVPVSCKTEEFASQRGEEHLRCTLLLMWCNDRDRNGSEDGACDCIHVCQVWGAWESPVTNRTRPPRVTDAKSEGAGYMFICDKQNIRQTKAETSRHTSVWFVNSSANIYEETTMANAVTEARIHALHNIQDKNCSIEEFRYRHLGIRTVVQINRLDGSRHRLICDCPFFWMSNLYC
jgi:hypothetical protein